MAATGAPLGEAIPQENQSDNVRELRGRAWSQSRGWFDLPETARVDDWGERTWMVTAATWMKIIIDAAEPSIGGDTWNDTYNPQPYWQSGWGKGGYDKKDRDGDVPEWDGKAGHRTTYFRKIDLWEATTGVEPSKRGIRLLAKLTGEAFEKLENVDPKTLLGEDSVERFKKCIIDVYEPIEDYRVGKIMDSFLDDFVRKKDQEIIDYNLAWSRELHRAEKVAGELLPKWKAHLYLKKMRLNPIQKSQVLTGCLGEYTV